MHHAYNFSIVTTKLQEQQQVLRTSMLLAFSCQHAMHMQLLIFTIMCTIIYWMMCAIYCSYVSVFPGCKSVSVDLLNL